MGTILAAGAAPVIAALINLLTALVNKTSTTTIDALIAKHEARLDWWHALIEKAAGKDGQA